MSARACVCASRPLLPRATSHMTVMNSFCATSLCTLNEQFLTPVSITVSARSACFGEPSLIRLRTARHTDFGPSVRDLTMSTRSRLIDQSGPSSISSVARSTSLPTGPASAFEPNSASIV